MTASLKHAQRVLSAAINAGFRESGVQSLRNLDDQETCPMVAVRTSGLALESIIGYLEDGEDVNNIRCVVSEGYLRMVVGMINQRFEANTERTLRFRDHLLKQDLGKSRLKRWRGLGRF
jgi:tRNA wybutosine-synthesizing protein 3